MPEESEHHRRSIADLIHDETEENDRNGKWIRADSADDALLFLGELELSAPFVEHRAADGEAEGRRHQPKEATQEQPPSQTVVRHVRLVNRKRISRPSDQKS